MKKLRLNKNMTQAVCDGMLGFGIMKLFMAAIDAPSGASTVAALSYGTLYGAYNYSVRELMDTDSELNDIKSRQNFFVRRAVDLIANAKNLLDEDKITQEEYDYIVTHQPE